MAARRAREELEEEGDTDDEETLLVDEEERVRLFEARASQYAPTPPLGPTDAPIFRGMCCRL
jgi:hypothetical protein